jgi:hypothetical protein
MADAKHIQKVASTVSAAVDPREIIQGSRSAHRLAVDEMMMKVQKTYVGMSSRDDNLVESIEYVIDGWARTMSAKGRGAAFAVGKLAEASVLFVVGESGAGKSRALERAFHKTPEFGGYGDPDAPCPLITVLVPSPFTLRAFAVSIYNAVGAYSEELEEIRESVIWSGARKILVGRVAVLHIDEAQNLMESRNPVEIEKARNALRNLVQNKEWPVSLILSGTPTLYKLMGEFQVGRRKEAFVVEPLDPDSGYDRQILCNALENFCKKAGISSGGTLTNDNMMDRLLHASLNRLGVAIDLMHLAIRKALRDSDKSLSKAHFVDAFARRTGCRPNENIFGVADGYRAIKTEPLLFRDIKPEDDEPQKKPRRVSYKREK